MTKYSLSARNKLWNYFKGLVQKMNITLTRKYSFMPKRWDDKFARTLGCLQHITRIPVPPSDKHPAYPISKTEALSSNDWHQRCHYTDVTPDPRLNPCRIHPPYWRHALMVNKNSLFFKFNIHGSVHRSMTQYLLLKMRLFCCSISWICLQSLLMGFFWSGWMLFYVRKLCILLV